MARLSPIGPGTNEVELKGQGSPARTAEKNNCPPRKAGRAQLGPRNRRRFTGQSLPWRHPGPPGAEVFAKTITFHYFTRCLAHYTTV